MKNIMLIALMVFTTQAFGSFVDECNFDVEVTNVSEFAKLNGSVNETRPLVGSFLVLSAEDLGGHTDCQGYVGTTRTLDLNGKRVNEGDLLKLHYLTFNSLTPEGVKSNTSYQIVK